LVPLIFDSYALDLASRLTEANPLDVLETATGTGVLTRAIACQAAIADYKIDGQQLFFPNARPQS